MRLEPDMRAPDLATARPPLPSSNGRAAPDRRRNRTHEQQARRTVQRAAHIVRHLAETLLDRPLSEANTPFVVDSFRALSVLGNVVAAHAPALPSRDRAEAWGLRHRLDRLLRDPAPAAIDGIGRFVRDGMALYTTGFESPVAVEPLTQAALRGRGFTDLIVMFGPGIGIGDEIKLADLVLRLGQGLGLAPDRIELYSFCPGIWRTLMPDLVSRGLSEAPLAAFERLDRYGPGTRPLAVFACFMHQETLRYMSPMGPSRDGMLVTVATGEVRVRFRDTACDYVAGGLIPEAPNFSIALRRLSEHLFPDAAGATTRRAALPAPRVARDAAALDLVVNPFTSKRSPLTPADWSELIALIRRATPPAKTLVCRIVPGLTPSCRAYARRIKALSSRRFGDTARIALIDDGRPPLTPDNALHEVHGALRRADLLLTIDTYAAHLAAHARTTTISLCLNRNVEFWDPAPYTFWLDMTAERSAVATMVRAIASVVARDVGRDGPLARLMAPARALAELAHISRVGDAARGGAPPRRLAHRWRRRADDVWAALPPAIVRASRALDGDDAWPAQRDGLTSAVAADRRIAANRIANSLIWRLAWLAGTARAAREQPR